MGLRERIFGSGPSEAEIAAMLAEGGEIAAEAPVTAGFDLTNALAVGGLDGLASKVVIDLENERREI